MRKSVLLPCLFVVMLNLSCAQDAENEVATPEKIPFTAELLIDEIQVPWGMTFLPDGSMLITEISGDLIHFKDGKKTMVSNAPEVYKRGQGGLLDVTLHPNYEDNGWIYITYSSDKGDDKGGHTALMRAKLKDNAFVKNELLYKATPNTTKGQHFGSRVVFGDDGYLYLTIGERGERDVNPQDITRDGGKIYRFNDDGSIPDDNPFADEPDAKKGIYSYGHRNPQGMIKHPVTGEIWVHEHGPRGGDEINVIEKGANYGWPKVTYGINYSGTEITDKTEMEGMTQPIHYWLPSIAPSGMAYVSTDTYGSDWKGSLLVGSLKFQYLERLDMDGKTVTGREKLMDGMGRVRSVEEGPDGIIYVGVEGKGIYKLMPKTKA